MPSRLNTFLTSSRELHQLADKARQLMALQRQVELVIPASMRRSCRVLQLDQQTLTLAVDTGAIAAKLRQMTTELAVQLQKSGCEVTVIQVQVQVSAPPYIPPPKPRALSRSGKSHLTELADQLTDSPLKDALSRLAKRN